MTGKPVTQITTPGKRPYQAPRLVVYGHAAVLTAAGSGVKCENGQGERDFTDQKCRHPYGTHEPEPNNPRMQRS